MDRSKVMCSGIALVLLLAAPSVSWGTEAEGPDAEEFYRPNQSPYRVNVALDLGIIVIGSLLTSVPRIMAAEGAGEGPSCGLECDLDDVNAMDRAAITGGSQVAADVSDAVMYGYISLAFVFDAIDVGVSSPRDGWRGFGKDFLVLLETMSVTLNVNWLVAMAVRRPRPYAYDEDNSDEFRTESEAAMSFYSGHTSVVFAVATAYSRLFMLRHPGHPLVVPIWLFGYAAAGTVGAMRVVSSAHFLSDVLVGAVTGVGFGLLIPWLHELPRDESSEVASIRIRPYFAGTTAGIHGSFGL